MKNEDEQVELNFFKEFTVEIKKPGGHAHADTRVCTLTHTHSHTPIYKYNNIWRKIKILALSYFDTIFPAMVCRKFKEKALVSSAETAVTKLSSIL